MTKTVVLPRISLIEINIITCSVRLSEYYDTDELAFKIIIIISSPAVGFLVYSLPNNINNNVPQISGNPLILWP